MFVQIANYLIHTLATLYTGCLLLRLLLQWCRADFYNPISQFVVKVTHPLVGPLRRVIPSLGMIDSATVVLVIAVESAVIVLLCLLNFGQVPWLAIVPWAVIGLASLLVHAYFVLLLAMIILSWVAPYSDHPAARLVWQLCEPVAAPVRRLVPPIGGLDFSVVFLFIGINVLKIVLQYAAVYTRLIPQLVPGFY